MRKRIWPVLLASAMGLVVLVTLGVWQVQRLAWKEQLIADLDSKLKSADASMLSSAISDHEAGKDLEYQRVLLEGAFIPGMEVRKLSSYQSMPAYEILQPFGDTNTGKLVLVHRGIVLEAQGAPRPPDPEFGIVTGIIRKHNKGRGSFDPDNDLKGNLWYWWDLPAMFASFEKLKGREFAPFIVQLTPESNNDQWPRALEVKAELRNNHLGYAITWFGLAAVLVVMTAVFVRQMRRPS
jgi:surfeit locus 1 family protein